MMLDGEKWDEPSGRCSQCGDKIPADGKCVSSQCNPPGAKIEREIRQRVKAEHQRMGRFKTHNPRTDITLEVLEETAAEAETVEDLRQVVLILIRQLRSVLTP